jgi:hypothetical protein
MRAADHGLARAVELEPSAKLAFVTDPAFVAALGVELA